MLKKPYFLISLAALSLAGASSALANCQSVDIPPQPKPALSNNIAMFDDLIAEGQIQNIQVVQKGDHFRIIFPARRLFELAGVKLKANSYTSLNRFAKLIINKSPKANITVAGFTEPMGSTNHEMQFSGQLANAVAAVFWANGMPHEQITVKAYGRQHPIVHNNNIKRNGANRRVEITF